VRLLVRQPGLSCDVQARGLLQKDSVPLRERIEGELDPAEHARRKQAAAQPPGRGLVLYEAGEFTELARARSP
jgi:hypothetical protein